MPGAGFYEVKKGLVIIFKKENGNTFNHFYSEDFKKSKIAQIYYYDPQSAGINLHHPKVIQLLGH